MNKPAEWGVDSVRWQMMSVDENILHRAAMVMCSSTAASVPGGAKYGCRDALMDETASTTWRSDPNGGHSGSDPNPSILIDSRHDYDISEIRITFKAGHQAKTVKFK